MPRLTDLVEKRKFVKKEYRPWDLSGTGTVDSKNKIPHPATKEPAATNSIIQAPETIKQPPVSEVVSTKDYTDETGNNTDNVSSNKQVTNKQQTDNIQVTKSTYRGNNQITIKEQTNNATSNITDNNEQAYLIDSIKKLWGIQKNIFFYIVDICTAKGTLDTGNILSSDLAHAANCSVGSAKTSLLRLIDKQLIIRLPGKACRGGHMVLGISREIQAATIQAQQLLFNPLKVIKTDNATSNILSNTTAYSSSNYKNNITTSLPEEWKKINFDLLSDIGFSETQLRQLFDSDRTSPEIVQDAINRFAYSLEHSEKVRAYSDPLNVLMGVLRKGQRWVEPNYISPKELALRELLEEKRRQKAERDAMVKELVELEFPEWRKQLTDLEVKKIVPAETLKTNLSPAITAALRTHYVENVLLPRLEMA